MIDIFKSKSYKEFVNQWVANHPKRGRGQYRKMALHLGVGTVLISQIFKGDRHLTEEQAVELAQYMNLLEFEVQFFMILVRLGRAGSEKLKILLRRDLEQKVIENENLKNRIQSDTHLDESQKAIFYSDWLYSAIRLAVDIPEYREIHRLSERLSLPIEKVKKALEFLVQAGLCELNQGQIQMGPKIVFLDADSPYILSRQRSWRIKGFQNMELSNKENLFFTCPLVCSIKTAKDIRSKTMKLISEVLSEVKDSPSEDLVCLNIDFFRIE